MFIMYSYMYACSCSRRFAKRLRLIFIAQSAKFSLDARIPIKRKVKVERMNDRNNSPHDHVQRF